MIYDNEDDNKACVVKRPVQPGHFPALANVDEEPFLHTGGVPNSKCISMWLMSTPKFHSGLPSQSRLRLSADLKSPSASGTETEMAPRRGAGAPVCFDFRDQSLV